MTDRLEFPPPERGKPFTGAAAAERFVEPTVDMYAEFGRFVALRLAASEAWWADEILQDIDQWLGEHWGYGQHPGNVSVSGEWDRIRDEVEHARERARAAAKAQIAEEGEDG